MGALTLTLRDVTDGIRAQPGRFTLSLLAIAVGMIAFSLLIAVLFALKEKSDRLVHELGVDVAAVVEEGTRKRLNIRQAALLAQNFPQHTITTIKRYQVPTLGTRRQLTVVATDHSLAAVRNWPVAAGRFLDRRDIEQRRRHAVVSRSLSESWNWKVGNIIYVRETPFTIVGIVDAGGHVSDGEQGDSRLMLGERVVLVPNTVVPYWDSGATAPHSLVDAIFVTGETGWTRTSLPAMQRVLNQPDLKSGKLAWITPELLLRDLNRLTRTITLTAGTIALLCLVLGGTTLVSLMVSNVRDRVTEIGLRRALGATRRDIALLFVLEAMLVTLLAGVVGTIAAHLLLLAGASNWPLPMKPTSISLGLPPAIAVVLGAVFAYWPAQAAARITPAEALRDE